MTMIFDEFISGQSIIRLLGDTYEYSDTAESRIITPSHGLRPRDKLLFNLAADVSRKCTENEARLHVMSSGGLRLICMTALKREKDGAMIFVGIDEKSNADVITIFSGRMPSKSRLLATVQELFNSGKYKYGALAHSFTDTDGITDAVYANELYQLAAEAGVSLWDYLVFRGVDCYSVRDQYRDFWK